MEKYYKTPEVCDTLKISRTTLWRKVRNKEIDEPVRDGSRYTRWTESSIVRYQQKLISRGL